MKLNIGASTQSRNLNIQAQRSRFSQGARENNPKHLDWSAMFNKQHHSSLACVLNFSLSFFLLFVLVDRCAFPSPLPPPLFPHLSSCSLSLELISISLNQLPVQPKMKKEGIQRERGKEAHVPLKSQLPPGTTARNAFQQTASEKMDRVRRTRQVRLSFGLCVSVCVCALLRSYVRGCAGLIRGAINYNSSR